MTLDEHNILPQRELLAMDSNNEETRAKEISEGKIYGGDYIRYNEDDIKKITDIEFLVRMFTGILPAAQPRFMWEFEMYCVLQRVIRARIDELQK